MKVSKIQLSEAEAELMQNAEVILTKNRVLEKMKQLLEGVYEEQQVTVERSMKGHMLFDVPGKISRGENYLGLPYLILDYPRRSDEGLFFIRTMFWWGRSFSSTLHLSGSYKLNYLDKIQNSYGLLRDFSIGIHENPWIHHFEKDNYRLLAGLSEKEFRDACASGDHLKLGMPVSLGDWPQASGKLMMNWKRLLKVCGLVADPV